MCWRCNDALCPSVFFAILTFAVLSELPWPLTWTMTAVSEMLFPFPVFPIQLHSLPPVTALQASGQVVTPWIWIPSSTAPAWVSCFSSGHPGASCSPPSTVLSRGWRYTFSFAPATQQSPWQQGSVLSTSVFQYPVPLGNNKYVEGDWMNEVTSSQLFLVELWCEP